MLRYIILRCYDLIIIIMSYFVYLQPCCQQYFPLEKFILKCCIAPYSNHVLEMLKHFKRCAFVKGFTVYYE